MAQEKVGTNQEPSGTRPSFESSISDDVKVLKIRALFEIGTVQLGGVPTSNIGKIETKENAHDAYEIEVQVL